MHDITVTGFRRVPPFAQGLVRDLRVRWALEEAGLPYEVSVIDFAEKDSVAYRRKHPFGLVPAFEADGRGLFESGAILLQIAETSEALMPEGRQGRMDTITWMFAALNTVEPSVDSLSVMDLQHDGEEWVKLRRPGVVAAVNVRLGALADWLEGRDYLVGRFTAADILMATVLRLIKHTDLVGRFPTLDGYVKRCEARSGFQKALAEQIAGYQRDAAPEQAAA